MRDTRDNEPCIISGEVCAETLTRLGCPRQAEWCRNADKRRVEMYAELERVARQRDELAERLMQHEPRAPLQPGVNWTGD